MDKKPYKVVVQNPEELEHKIHEHRKKIAIRILIVTVLVLIVAGALYFFFQTRKYKDYQILESVKRQDSLGTQFAEFNENILKYSNDGAFYINAQNQLIWNQTYEMQSPVVDICAEYATIYEKKGRKVYIMNTAKTCGEISTEHPIQQVHVANQGTVAILMEENGTGYIHIYDKEGTFLAEGELHTKNSGYPLDIAISEDGKKMAVSMLDVNEGNVKTTVAFYNFGSVGQNEIDNIVSSYSYSDTVMLKVEFLTNNLAVGIGDNRLVIFEGTQKPEVKKEIEVTREIQSIFYNEHYIGLVFENENKEQAYAVEVYGLNGNKEKGFDFSMEYDAIEFLENDEICIRNDLECSIYTLRGIQRFHYNFDENIYKIIHAGGRQYIFLMSETTEKVKLK